MQWNANELGFLANQTCTICRGTGIRRHKRDHIVPCRCALRAAFRACHARFKLCVESSRMRSRVSYERNPSGRSHKGSWGRKDQEYMADFELTARRVLDPWHLKVFRFHFILGADAALCCRRLRVDRGGFFHAVYRIEALLGEAFVLLRPYALYPPRDYFAVRVGAAEQTGAEKIPA
ncbi:MAG: hypothetical protein H6509_09505 [Bryobacterales bacterium]|nr:hypothetical protein [Acidobacteriota bacterium]MCB9384841.1 hypothetical protein [Bryobacterales bacterium]